MSPSNNSAARRAERRAGALARAGRPVVDCTACGHRHAVVRECWGGARAQAVQPNSRGFRRVLRAVARRAADLHWVWIGSRR